MREVKGLPLRDQRLNLRPCLALRCIREQVHDNCPSVDSLFDGEERFAGNPAILHGLSPTLTVLADTDNDVEAIIACIETLPVSLGAVADESKGVVLEVLLELGERPVGALEDFLLDTGKTQSLHAPRLCNPSNQ